MAVARRACEDASASIVAAQKTNKKITKEQLMEMTIYALLEALWKLASNHNETFVNDDAPELNVEETQEA